jgi:hypothetical protein
MLIRRFARRPRPLDASRADGPNDLERHVARCRRSGCAAALLVARTADGTALPAAIEQALRVSDSWLRNGPFEIVLLCDAVSLDRALVERRLRDIVSGELLCGWAGFPDDGLVVEDLVASARRDALAKPARRRGRPELLVAEG